MEVIKSLKPGMSEYQLESIFRHYCYYHGGMRNCAYTPICASGTNAAVLHYGHAGAPNDKLIEVMLIKGLVLVARSISPDPKVRFCMCARAWSKQDGEFVLMDMGAEYNFYASDITTTVPSGGSFTPDHRIVYEAVLSAKNSVEKNMKPGASWKELHVLAEKCILEGLKEGGLLKGDVDTMVQKRVGMWCLEDRSL